MKTETLRLRVDPEFKKHLEEAVASCQAKNMSSLIRAAVKKFLEERGLW